MPDTPSPDPSIKSDDDDLADRIRAAAAAWDDLMDEALRHSIRTDIEIRSAEQGFKVTDLKIGIPTVYKLL